MDAMLVVDVTERTGWIVWVVGAWIDPLVHEKAPVSVSDAWSLEVSPRLPPEMVRPATLLASVVPVNPSSPLAMVNGAELRTASTSVSGPL